MLLTEMVRKLSVTATIEDISAAVRDAALKIAGEDHARVILGSDDNFPTLEKNGATVFWEGNAFPIKVYSSQNRQPTDSQIQLFQTLEALAATTVERVEILNSMEEKVKERTVVLQSLNDELEALSFTISHDLKSPLTGIKNNCYLLQRKYGDRLDETGRESIAWIDYSVGRMREQIDAILAMFKVTKVQVCLSEVNLSALASEVIRNLRDENTERAVDVEIQPDLITLGDESLLLVVLENLLGNAWKYTRKNDKITKIELGMEDTEGDGFPIYYVRDNGIGFDSQKAEKLFQPFQRMHNPADFEGTGVGLASVKRIIRKHGGTIWAESKSGAGATFYFTIPTEAPLSALEDTLEGQTHHPEDLLPISLVRSQ